MFVFIYNHLFVNTHSAYVCTLPWGTPSKNDFILFSIFAKILFANFSNFQIAISLDISLEIVVGFFISSFRQRPKVKYGFVWKLHCYSIWQISMWFESSFDLFWRLPSVQKYIEKKCVATFFTLPISSIRFFSVNVGSYTIRAFLSGMFFRASYVF